MNKYSPEYQKSNDRQIQKDRKLQKCHKDSKGMTAKKECIFCTGFIVYRKYRTIILECNSKKIKLHLHGATYPWLMLL